MERDERCKTGVLDLNALLPGEAGISLLRPKQVGTSNPAPAFHPRVAADVRRL
jgi:hypothetical protein